MEYASILAGANFSDHPKCTHPLLAQVARTVNDALDDDNRQHVAPLVPQVIEVRNPAVDVTAALVAALTDSALRYEPSSRRLVRFHRRAVRRSRATGLGHWAAALSEPGYRTGAAIQAASLSLRVINSAGTCAMREALERTVTAARSAAQLPAPVELAASAAEAPRPTQDAQAV
jgi:hypothetical protein